ncbi:MAG: HAMP domain-containing protein, partial [Pseudomonadota bacterium]
VLFTVAIQRRAWFYIINNFFMQSLVASIAFATVLVVSLQVINLMLVSNAVEQRAMAESERDLTQAASVFDQFLTLTTQLASETTAVSAKDFNLKQWLAGDDLQTKASVLRTIRSRTDADWTAYVTLREVSEVTTGGPLAVDAPFPFPDLLETAALSPSVSATAFGTVDGKLQLLVVVAVDAPRTLGYLVTGFHVNEAFLASLHAGLPLGLSTTFVEGQGAGGAVVSDLPSGGGAGLSRFLGEEPRVPRGLTSPRRAAAEFAGEQYLSVATALASADSGRDVTLWFHSSLDRMRRESAGLIRSLGLLLAISLLPSMVLALVLGRTLSRPVRVLATAAERVRDGDYAGLPLATVPGKDEVGVLSHSFRKGM